MSFPNASVAQRPFHFSPVGSRADQYSRERGSITIAASGFSLDTPFRSTVPAAVIVIL